MNSANGNTNELPFDLNSALNQNVYLTKEYREYMKSYLKLLKPYMDGFDMKKVCQIFTHLKMEVVNSSEVPYPITYHNGRNTILLSKKEKQEGYDIESMWIETLMFISFRATNEQNNDMTDAFFHGASSSISDYVLMREKDHLNHRKQADIFATKESYFDEKIIVDILEFMYDVPGLENPISQAIYKGNFMEINNYFLKENAKEKSDMYALFVQMGRNYKGKPLRDSSLFQLQEFVVSAALKKEMSAVDFSYLFSKCIFNEKDIPIDMISQYKAPNAPRQTFYLNSNNAHISDRDVYISRETSSMSARYMDSKILEQLYEKMSGMPIQNQYQILLSFPTFVEQDFLKRYPKTEENELGRVI